ncbi:cupredoxin domain-containing protein [Methanolobus chelungpuianus]|uniref:Uncharacterized protein n=1 Tax=Methanolobus chelungpuianus TaxID=502115 RepID=A0AAE3KVS2_9EURY|nr:cupredoxin domain-containing protein [Methanolobus chelungpuianus]MCQ6961702.1 hypothetical protein [Methanolobus chelungpuianus]
MFIFLIALVIVSGCTEEQAESDDTTEQPIAPAVEENAEEESASAVATQEYGVRLDYTYFSPAELEINRGDTITWRNNNKQKIYTLVSNEGLFENQVMKYGNVYHYTFENRGTYNFSEAETPEMTMTVNVR